MQSQDTRNGDKRIKLSDALARSGISKLVLHTWERRYNVALSHRTQTGRRFMTQDQVKRLGFLKIATDAGYRIGDIISLTDAALFDIVERRERVIDLRAVLEAAERLDSQTLAAELDLRRQTEGPVGFVHRVAVPLMDEIDRRCVSETFSMVSQHLASIEIRRVLSSSAADCFFSKGAPRAIATTLHGDMQEIGALVATLLSRCHGWETLYLGPNLPHAEIARAAHMLSVQRVFISIRAAKSKTTFVQLAALRAVLPVEIGLWVEGPAASDLVVEGVRIFSSPEGLEDALAEQAGKSSRRAPR